ncbi:MULTISPECIES: chemotaxis protein CheW [unclassified Methylophaga]|jgi:chemosensory pili system protein ChpC|uniref:chemotaxis protein CheW n=1 Tax=unclassified Methylophaga TaxID=2629249 RepID=UPI00259D3160|nr:MULTISPECIES: chemotaxis protein CheW [unclassified Methylophaga]|tara:strand:+ start:10526 stop:11014 length:489 start_codon:yes stop_codon:yes gene_type:complete
MSDMEKPAQAQFVHCMLIPLQKHYLLLPNSTITEVLPKATIKQAATKMTPWLEWVEWQQKKLAVVDLETLLKQNIETLYPANKLCIIEGINADADIGYYAIPCTGSPQLITLNASALKMTHDQNNSDYLYCQIKVGNKVAFIPNLDKLEIAIKNANLSAKND